MRVLIADRLAATASERLSAMGADVCVEPALVGIELTRRMSDFDPHVLVVRSTRVTAADIDAAHSLALVIRAGAGVNTIDVTTASARGIYVANCPGKNAGAVAELTIGHLINLDRRIADNVAELRAGRWNKRRFGASRGPEAARGLRGRLLAVLGTGRIGREVIVRARALGMRVRAWSRSLGPEDAAILGVEHAATPQEAVAGADAVTVHLALAGETRGLVGTSVFAAMKPGAYFINTSRADVVDAEALAHALADKGLRVGLDVFAAEPAEAEGRFADPLCEHPDVYGTHHIGASTLEAAEAVAEQVARIAHAYAAGALIPDCVNLATESQATHRLVVRLADHVGVLAGVLDRLREAGINVQGIQNIVFSGGEAACARIELVGAPDLATLGAIRKSEHVFDASVTELSDGA
jgi:D-3-phosphoglycerate dehydrogenase